MSEYIKQNFTKGQTLKADHMNYIEDGIVSIEERMEGLPYVETTMLFPEFDGNLTNKETVEWDGRTYVKLSSVPVSKEDMVGMTLMANQHGDIVGEPLNEHNITETEMNGIKVVMFSYAMFSVFGDIATDEVPFTKGVWSMYIYDDSDPDYPPYIMYIITIKSETIHPLDEKFLPESVDGVIIRSSTEGSTKKFKLTVDDAGTVTATEV